MNLEFDLTRYMIDNASESSASISHECLAEHSLSAGKDSASESNTKENSAGFSFALSSAAYLIQRKSRRNEAFLKKKALLCPANATHLKP